MRERGAKTQAKRAKKARAVLNKFNKIIKQIITFKNHCLKIILFPGQFKPDWVVNFTGLYSVRKHSTRTY